MTPLMDGDKKISPPRQRAEVCPMRDQTPRRRLLITERREIIDRIDGWRHCQREAQLQRLRGISDNFSF